MKPNILTIASLLSILLSTFPLADDIIRGDGKGRDLKPRCCTHPGHLPVRNACARRTAIGYIIILLGSLLGLAIPVVHMKWAGVGAEVAKAPSGAFFFVWAMIALGVTALFSVIISVRGLGRPQWGQSQ